MNDIEKRARELLERHTVAINVAVEDGSCFMVSEQDALDAIRAALTPPGGYVLVSAELLEDLAAEAEAGIHQTIFHPAKREKHMRKVQVARELLASRPEVSP